MADSTESYNVSPDQRHAMAVTERVVSVFSIIGILFIVSTYLLYPGFNKPINRLVFFTAIGNFGLNFAALIAEDGPARDETSPLCQFQGFMVQMFLGVDAYWSLCMALNVYLVFFSRYNVLKLRRMDITYLITCYGLSFIIAITFLAVERGDRPKIYGDAILWCWVSRYWAGLRIGLVYSVSWLAIALAIIVYCQAGLAVWKRRDELHGMLMNPFNQNPLKHTVTTEIHVTTEARRPSQSSANHESESVDFGASDNYSVTVDVSAQDYRHKVGIFEMRSLTRTAAATESNTEALLYARAAFFYFVVLLVTWIPSSVNRAYAVTHNTEVVNFPLNYISSLLLPAQGICNCIVYILTSRPAVVLLYEGG